MAPTPENVILIVHYNGVVSRNQFGSFFESEQRKCFNCSVKSTFAHLKKRIAEKLYLSDSQVITKIVYRAPQSYAANNIQYNDVQICNNNEVAHMFATHKYYEMVGSIELMVTVENREVPQPCQIPQNVPYTQPFSQPQYEYEPSSSQQLSYNLPFTQT